MGNINLTLEGYSNRVVESMVSAGYAKTKSEALRLALYEFDRSHQLVSDGLELVARKIKVEQTEMKKKGLNYLPLDEAVSKYE